MRKTTTLASLCAIALGALSLTSCIVSESGFDHTAGIKFKAGIEGASVAQTRTNNGGDSWVVGDGVGIYMLSTDGKIPSNVLPNMGNKRYNVNTLLGELSPDAKTSPVIDYPASGAAVDFIAYYPYSNANEDKIDKNGVYSVTLTDQSVPEKIDVLIAKKTDVSGGPVDLDFYHALSKITLNIKLEAGATTLTSADVAAITDVQLSATPGVAGVNLNTGAITDGPNANIPLLKSKTAATGYDATFSAIVAPTGDDGGGRYLSIKMGAKTVVWSIPTADKFAARQNYVYWGEITETEFRVMKSNIMAWNSNDKGQTVEQVPAKIQQNHRITWDGSKYVLTTDPTNAGLYFRFGGVVGIYTGAGVVQTLPVANTNTNRDTFEAAVDIAWDPTDSVIGDGADGWATVPLYNDNGTDYPTYRSITPESGYHTIENVKAGKGDPCRLVGLDLAKIKAAVANPEDVYGNDALSYADIDNGKWRMPTAAENQSFSGRDTNGVYTEHCTQLDGVNGGMFPNKTLGDATTFLPAVGLRNTSLGQVGVQSQNGDYWSSTVYSASSARNLYFRATGASADIIPQRINNGTHGFAVRCVRQ